MTADQFAMLMDAVNALACGVLFGLGFLAGRQG